MSSSHPFLGGRGPPKVPINQNVLPSDEKRAQELDQYLRPLAPTHLHSHFDLVLTAHMQLIAWRLGVQRALVSFVDRDTQYLVAEATKTTNLRDCNVFEEKDDELWAGVS